MVRSFLRNGSEVVVVTPRSSPLRELEGTSGIRAVLSDDDLTEELLAPLLAGRDPVAPVIDDAELLKEISGKDWLRAFIRTAGDRNRAVVISGNAAEICQGFSGWQVDVKKNRNGALFSPQNRRLTGRLVDPEVAAGRRLCFVQVKLHWQRPSASGLLTHEHTVASRGCNAAGPVGPGRAGRKRTGAVSGER